MSNTIPTENPDIGKAEDPQADIGGTKYDKEKAFGSVVYEYFPRAIEAVSEVSTFGARKYARGGWAYVPNGITRYTDAMHRHMLAEAKGEIIDPDSQLKHAAHAAWGALCRLELLLREEEKAKEILDDRYKCD